MWVGGDCLNRLCTCVSQLPLEMANNLMNGLRTRPVTHPVTLAPFSPPLLLLALQRPRPNIPFPLILHLTPPTASVPPLPHIPAAPLPPPTHISHKYNIPCLDRPLFFLFPLYPCPPLFLPSPPCPACTSHRYNIARLDRPLFFLFWQRLLSSGVRVANGDEADYFFIPIKLRMGWVDNENALAAVRYIRQNFPWWDKHGGGGRHIVIHTGVRAGGGRQVSGERGRDFVIHTGVAERGGGTLSFTKM